MVYKALGRVASEDVGEVEAMAYSFEGYAFRGECEGVAGLAVSTLSRLTFWEESQCEFRACSRLEEFGLENV